MKYLHFIYSLVCWDKNNLRRYDSEIARDSKLWRKDITTKKKISNWQHRYEKHQLMVEKSDI